MAIKDWPIDERPREKLLAKGAEALSDAELLAILLRSGYAKQTAVDLARQLLAECGGVVGLRQARYQDFSRIRGLGLSHFVAVQAGIALANRALLSPIKKRHAVDNIAATRAFLLSQLNFEVREVFWGLFLDSQYRVIASQALFYGTLNQASVYPREVLNACLHHHAAALIVAHNHPSGILRPSQADIDITLQLRQALALVDIELLDHVVVAGGKTLSLAETGHFYAP